MLPLMLLPLPGLTVSSRCRQSATLRPWRPTARRGTRNTARRRGSLPFGHSPAPSCTRCTLHDWGPCRKGSNGTRQAGGDVSQSKQKSGTSVSSDSSRFAWILRVPPLCGIDNVLFDLCADGYCFSTMIDSIVYRQEQSLACTGHL